MAVSPPYGVAARRRRTCLTIGSRMAYVPAVRARLRTCLTICSRMAAVSPLYVPDDSQRLR